MRPLNRAVLFASSLALCGGAALPAAAQETAEDAPENVTETIVVRGIRGSLRTSLEGRREAENVVEVLTAEDIGRLPDISIAESLARLPGLTTNRDRGNGTQITIRGMPPQLVNTLLNGRELVAAGADRNIRYEQYPAELITGAYVYKSPTASQVEGAIAGQVDLHTINPLDYDSDQLVLSYRRSYSDLAADIADSNPEGFIASGSYVGQFLNDTLGVAIGFSTRSQPVATVRTNIFRYTNGFADYNGDGAGNDEIPFGFEALVRGGEDNRTGGIATIRWRPDNLFTLQADVFYSLVEYTELQRGFRVDGMPFGNSFTDPTVVDGGVIGITATNFADFGLNPRNVNEFFTFTDELWAGGLNGRWTGDDWRGLFDIGYSTTHRDQMFLTVRTEVHDISGPTPVRDVNGVSGTFLSSPGNVPFMGFNFDLTDPLINLVADAQIPENGGGAPIVNDEMISLNGSLEFDINAGIFRTLEGGFRVTDRSKDYTQRTQFGFVDPASRAPLPASLMGDPLQFPGDYSGLPSTMTYDILGTFNYLFGAINPQESIFDSRSSWVVGEATYAAFLQSRLEGNLGSIPFTGNLGVRVVHTETRSDSTRVEQGPPTFVATATPISFTNEFTDVLPTLNLTFELSEQQQVRLALSRAIARAPLDDLNAGFGLFIFGAPSAFGGNPELEPFRANQIDLTYEHYFNEDTAFIVALFYKDLDTFIVPQVTDIIVDVGGVPTPGTFRQPINGEGGYIRGIELMYQQAFSFLPAPFDGLGIYANYSYTQSDVSVNEADNFNGSMPLTGLSEHVANLTLYYFRNGFETRLAYRYRSGFPTELGDTDRLLFNQDEGILDFQASYDFSEGPLNGLGIFFHANNLTDEPFETYYGDERRQGRFENFGRRFFFGATYQFGGD